MAKQKVIADLFDEWAASYSMLPPYIEALWRENSGTVIVWISRTAPLLIQTNSNAYFGILVCPSRDSRVVVL